MTRGDCHQWLEAFGVPHEVQKSACVFCPFKSNAEWRRLRDTDAEGWSRAIQIDTALRVPGNVVNRSVDQKLSQAKHGVGAMWNLYRWYALGRVHPKLNSPFWRGFRAIDSAINGAPDAALWTNVFKVNVNGSVMKNCKAAEVAALQRAQQGLLAAEIAILNPDVVVFFSGPRYESSLRCEFPDMKISPLLRRAPASAVGVVRAAGLPVRTIRTYHPEYLQRSRQLGLLSVISRWAGLCPQPVIGASQTHAVNQRPDSEIGSTRRRPR